MTHVWNRLWKQGGNFGIGGSIITQRPQDVNKKSLELSAAVFAFNVTGVNALKAMRAWMGDAETDRLTQLQPGECVLWSPSWLRRTETLKISPKATFHARFDPHSVVVTGANRAIASVDVSLLKERFAALEDPKTQAIIGLDKTYSQAEGLPDPEIDRLVAQEVERATAPLLKQIQEQEWLLKEGAGLAERLRDLFSLEAKFGEMARDRASLEIPEDMQLKPVAPKVKRAVVKATGTSDLPKPQQRMLDTLRLLESLGVAEADRGVLAFFQDVSPATGSFKNYLSALKTSGHIEYRPGSRVSLTPTGRDIAEDPAPITSLTAHQDGWLSRLSGPLREILTHLIGAYPQPVTRQELADRRGVSPTTGSFKNYVSRLRSLGLIDYVGNGGVVATPLLFPKK